jgi:hypothetical protein
MGNLVVEQESNPEAQAKAEKVRRERSSFAGTSGFDGGALPVFTPSVITRDGCALPHAACENGEIFTPEQTVGTDLSGRGCGDASCRNCAGELCAQ